MKKSANFCCFVFVCFSLYMTSPIHAEVIVPDKIATVGEPVMLQAETRKGFFRKGGELVEFFLDGKSIGKNLSGGDGIAYRELKPGKAGLEKVSAESGKDRGEGLLLVLRKGGGIIFIDIDGSLKSGQFDVTPRKGSKAAIELIAKRFPIVYLRTGLFGGFEKGWLAENGFREAPLVPWDNGSVFEDVSKMGLKVYAVIGSSAIVISSKDIASKEFTFDEEVEGAKTVASWDDIANALR